MPSGAEPADIGGQPAARSPRSARPGSLAPIGAARVVDAAGQIVMPGGVDPHIHCSSPIPFPGRNEDLLSAPPEQVSRAALYGGTTTMLDFAPCPPDQPLQQSIELRQREWAGACYCDYGFHLLLHGKLSQGVLDPLPEAIQAGSRLGQDVHHRHPAEPAGPHGAVRRHLGGAEDPRRRRRDRRDPRRGQRHRHAHVRKADPRRPGRLREHGRGAQHLVGGSVVQPGDPAGRECRGRCALHGACLGGDRGRRDRRVAGAGLPDVRRNPAPIPALHRRGLQAPRRADVPHLPVAQIRQGPGGAVGGDQSRRDPGGRDRRGVLPVEGQAAGTGASTTRPAAIPGSSRGSR